MMPIPHSGQIIRVSQLNELLALNEPTFVYVVGELTENQDSQYMQIH